MGTRTEAGEYFWELVEPLLAEDGIEEGSLMGFPCLRFNGAFFGEEYRPPLLVDFKGRVAQNQCVGFTKFYV